MSRAIALIFLTALLAAPASAQKTTFKCVDANGKTYYTQVPPPECLGRATEELTKSGSVLKKEAPLTAEQRAAIEAERKKKLEDEEKAKEERRKNLALLNTYSSAKDVDEARARSLKDNEEAIRQSEKNIATGLARQKELAAEKEFYTKKPMPPKLSQDIRDNELLIKNQNELLEAKKKQIAAINAKYDEDKRRYVELTRDKSSGAKNAK